MELQKQHQCHGGVVAYYQHHSARTNTPMRFSFFEPEAAVKTGAYIIFLSGLTCTEDNFTTKAHAYKVAAELGLCVLAPDTSPRGEGVADSDDYDLGQGAGFYIDAVREPWLPHFQMESYLIKELLPLCEDTFDLDASRKSITGHSMGGHGALTLYFKHQKMFRSCSAFAPIVAPTQVPWGRKAFQNYLGDDHAQWQEHDATELVARAKNPNQNAPILIDQGLDDSFLKEQLKPEMFEKACAESGQSLTLRQHEGYDHSYFFIESFIADHLKWHHSYM